MRLIRAIVGLLSLVAVLISAVPAASAPDSEPSTVCTVTDQRLSEISGFVAREKGYAAINDGGDEVQIYLLNQNCDVADVTVVARKPRDPEDLARTPDGTLWVGDLGDNGHDRSTAAVWAVKPGATDVLLYRLQYPDGPHDAEALLMPANKTPIVVTKEITGAAQVYQAVKPLSGPESTIDMKSVGSISFKKTGTPGGEPTAGAINQIVVTGGALSADGRKAVLRTYTDAYEWDIPSGGDIATSITAGSPRRTALPNEPQGEAISYTMDGSAFLTISEKTNQPLHKWAPARKTENSHGAKAAAPEDKEPWYADITLDQLMYFIYGIGVLGVLLVTAGVIGIVRYRRRHRSSNMDGKVNLVSHGNGVYGSAKTYSGISDSAPPDLGGRSQFTRVGSRSRRGGLGQNTH